MFSPETAYLVCLNTELDSYHSGEKDVCGGWGCLGGLLKRYGWVGTILVRYEYTYIPKLSIPARPVIHMHNMCNFFEKLS